MDFLYPGEKLRKAREQLGLKQSELAGPGMSRNYISMIEDGKRPLTERAANTLANAINSAAVERNIDYHIDSKHLMETPAQSAYKYCMERVGSIKVISSMDELLYYGNKYNLPEVILKCYIKRGNLHFRAKCYIDALSDYNEALQLVYMGKSKDSMVDILNKVGGCYIQLLDYNSAVIYLTKAWNSCCLNENNRQRKLIIYNISLCYCNMGKYDKAIETLEKYYNPEYGSDTDINKDKLRCSMLLIKGGALLECGRLKEAEELYIGLLERVKEDNKSKAYCLHNLGTINYKLGKYKKAEIMFIKSIVLRKVHDKAKISTTFIELGEMYKHMDIKNKAVYMLEKGIEFARQYEVYKDMLNGCELLEEIYVQNKNLDKLETTYIELLKLLEGNKKMLYYRNLVLSKMGLLFLERNRVDKCIDCLRKQQES